MLIVIALGGNALLQRGQPLEAELQRYNISVAAHAIAGLIAEGHRVVITHGNGPQVGLLALQSEAYTEVAPYPFDILNAETQSMIGYMLQQAIINHFPEKKIITLITQTLVDASDVAFREPTKFIGPFYSKSEAHVLQQSRQWTMKEELNQYRRVISSPKPKAIIELETIQFLVSHNINVICAGGGGIPVIRCQEKLHGVEAVVDKDLTSALLAIALHADFFVILTDVSGIFEHWPSSSKCCLKSISYQKLEKMYFSPGTMAPKVEAVCEFVKKTKNKAAIGPLSGLKEIIQGELGTRITQ